MYSWWLCPYICMYVLSLGMEQVSGMLFLLSDEQAGARGELGCDVTSVSTGFNWSAWEGEGLSHTQAWSIDRTISNRQHTFQDLKRSVSNTAQIRSSTDSLLALGSLTRISMWHVPKYLSSYHVSPGGECNQPPRMTCDAWWSIFRGSLTLTLMTSTCYVST